LLSLADLIIKNIYARILSILYFTDMLFDSPQNSFDSIPSLGIKLYSCISFAHNVLSKSYNKATIGFAEDAYFIAG
jgi:hypothetical protein